MSPTLAGRYQLYKAGTQKIVNFLKDGAACSQSKKGSGAAPSSLTTADLVRFAQLIAASRPPIEIPSGILELITDVIEGREVCALWYEAHRQESGSRDMADSDQSHRHFIDVLRRVYHTLQTARKQLRTTKRTAKTSGGLRGMDVKADALSEHSAKESLANLFTHLDIEEPSSAPLGKSIKVSTAKMPELDQSVTIELDEAEERRFALWCFLEDMHDIRKEIKRVWTAYGEGKASFLAASAVTETAFGVMRRADEEISKTSPELVDWEVAVDFLGLELQFDESKKPYIGKPYIGKPHIGPSETDAEVSKVPVHELLCPLGAATLRCVQGVWLGFDQLAALREAKESVAGQRFEIFKHKESGVSTEIVLVSREEREKAQRDPSSGPNFHPFAAVLYDNAAELRLLFEKGVGEPGTDIRGDEFVSGLNRLRMTKHLRVWMVVACQAYMDIVDATSHSLEIGRDELRKATLRIKSSLDLYELFRESSRMETWTSTADVAELKEMLDRNYDIVNPSPRRCSTPGCECHLQPDIFAQLLLSSAHKLYIHHIVAHRVGITMFNDLGCVHVVAHLYTALRQNGFHVAVWKDMEWLLATLGSERSLVCSSKGMTAHLRHLQIALGFRLSDLSSGKGTRVITCDPRKQRDVEMRSKFLRAVKGQSKSDRELGFSRGELADVVLRTMAEPTPATQKSERACKSATPPGAVTGLQLVERFKRFILQDEEELAFDYVGFWTQSMMLLRQISEAVTPLLPPKPFTEPDAVNNLVLDILTYGAAAEYHRRPWPKALVVAAELMNAYIESVAGEPAAAESRMSASNDTSLQEKSESQQLSGTQSDIGKTGALEVEAAVDESKRMEINGPDTAEGPVNVEEVFAARRKKHGRRLLRNRK